MYTDYPETFQATFPTATEASPQLASSLKFSQLDTTPDPTTWVRERGPVTFPSLPAGTIPVGPSHSASLRPHEPRPHARGARSPRARAGPETGSANGGAPRLAHGRAPVGRCTHARTHTRTDTNTQLVSRFAPMSGAPPADHPGPLYSIVQYSIDRPVFSGQYSAAVFDRPRAAVFDRPNEQARSLGPPPPATSEHRVGLGSSERAQQTDAGTVFDQRAFDPHPLHLAGTRLFRARCPCRCADHPGPLQ